MTRNPACAICGREDLPVSLTQWDSRTVVACSSCTEPVPDTGPAFEPRLRHRVASVLRRASELTVSEIGEQLGIVFAEKGDDLEAAQQYDSLSHIVMRMVRNGFLSRDDQYPAHYTLIKEPPVPQWALPPEKRRKRKPAGQGADQTRREEKRQYARDRRAQAAAEGRCQWCLAGLPDGWEFKKCVECREKDRRSRAKYQASGRRREVDAVSGKRRYWDDPEKARAAQRAWFLERKLSGMCQWCSAKATSDSNYCQKHKLRVAEVSREHKRRLRARAA